MTMLQIAPYIHICSRIVANFMETVFSWARSYAMELFNVLKPDVQSIYPLLYLTD